MEHVVEHPPENAILPETITTTLATKNNEIKVTFIQSTNKKEEKPKLTSNHSSSADIIASSQDLLTEIFLRLPVITLVRFTCVSKQWNTFIKSHGIMLTRNLNNPEPPLGLFFEGWDVRYKYRYVPLDIGNSVSKPPFKTLSFDVGAIKILQSCNGLLLCVNDFQKYYVYNPTTNQYTMLPQHNYYNLHSIICMTLAFDSSRSCHYKVVCIYMHGVMKMEVYSSESRKWKVLNESMDDLVDVDRGVYGHNAIHWMSFPNRLVYLKLDEEILHDIDIDTPDTTIYGTILDEFLAESRDGMLLVVRCSTFRRLNVYEIKKNYYDWCIKYYVDLEEVIRVYPRLVTRLGLHFVVQSFVLGEREEDSFIVLELPGLLIQYKFLLNSISQLRDFTNDSRRCTHGGFFPKTMFQLSDFTPENRRFINGSCFHFIPSLAAV
ncbi:F-box protein-like protein [Tanacetum coccineum]|uniref:F-box protein-like protein n=1 Tax=Tanacetum coccineum TaxID=301880 RepID=A0ABQ5GFC6_9ASTR